jgi:hypothetical protein
VRDVVAAAAEKMPQTPRKLRKHDDVESGVVEAYVFESYLVVVEFFSEKSTLVSVVAAAFVAAAVSILFSTCVIARVEENASDLHDISPFS